MSTASKGLIEGLEALCKKLDDGADVETVIAPFLKIWKDSEGAQSAEVYIPTIAGQYALEYCLKGSELSSSTLPMSHFDASFEKIMDDPNRATAGFAFSSGRRGVISLVFDSPADADKTKDLCDNILASDGALRGFIYRVSLYTENKSFIDIIENMPSCVFVCDIDMEKVYFANKNMRELFYSKEKGYTILDKLRKLIKASDEDSKEKPNGHSLEFFCETKDIWFHMSESVLKSHCGAVLRLVSMENINDKIQYEKTIEKQTLFDGRTGLPNRKQLDLDFQDIIRYAEDDNENGMMLFIDIDNFKIVNDRFGHQYGDLMLKEIGSYLNGLSKYGAMAYAFGGDEFLILIPHLSIHNSSKIIDEILKRFNDRWILDDVSYTTSVSVGTALFPRDGSSLGSLLQKVDMSVYKAKIDGKGRLIEYKESFANSLTRYMDIVREMRTAVLNDCKGFYVSYQPIVSAQTKQPESAEALLRWRHPELGNISPGEFIPIAEDTGLIIPLGKFVLLEAMSKCREWCKQGFIKHMNINLSVEQMIRADFIETVKDAVSVTGVDPKTIVFEITESIAIKDLTVMNEIIGNLIRLGFKMALDDFGTGYSSFNCFKDLQLGIVKLDKSFIDNVSINKLDTTMVRSIVNLSHEFRLDVCAEGVEQPDQYHVLKDMGVDLIQGYLFSRPQEASTLESGFFKEHTIES